MIVALCTGFADCFFKAAQVTYKIAPCPPETFAWPKLQKSEDGEMEMERMPFKGGGRIECEKLTRYQVRMKFKKTLFIRQDWSTLDAYVGITRGTSCQLLIGIALIGPRVSDSQMVESTEKLVKGVPKLLFQGTPYIADAQSEKIDVIGGTDEAVEWCKKLPISDSEKK